MTDWSYCYECSVVMLPKIRLTEDGNREIVVCPVCARELVVP